MATLFILIVGICVMAAPFSPEWLAMSCRSGYASHEGIAEPCSCCPADTSDIPRCRCETTDRDAINCTSGKTDPIGHRSGLQVSADKQDQLSTLTPNAGGMVCPDERRAVGDYGPRSAEGPLVFLLTCSFRS